MGVEAKTKARKFLPLIGEVQLRYGVATRSETIDQIVDELKKVNDIRFIIGKLGKLYFDVKDFRA